MRPPMPQTWVSCAISLTCLLPAPACGTHANGTGPTGSASGEAVVTGSAVPATTSAGPGDEMAGASTLAQGVDLRAWLARHGIKSWKNAVCRPNGVEIEYPGYRGSSALPREWCTCDRTVRLGSRELLACDSLDSVSTQSVRSALYRVDGDALVLVPPALTVAGGWTGTTRPGPEFEGPRSPDPTFWITFGVSYRFEVDGDAVVLNPAPNDYYSCERHAERIRDAWKAPFDPSFARQRRDFVGAVNAAKEACNNRGRYYYQEEGSLVRDPASAPPPM